MPCLGYAKRFEIEYESESKNEELNRQMKMNSVMVKTLTSKQPKRKEEKIKTK
jgi:hypothetical protein